MYRDNSVLKRPSNNLQPLWRYLSYGRLIELLSTGLLYFRRLSLMDDKWEGLLTEKTRNRIFNHFYAQYRSAEVAKYQIEDYEKHRHDFYINCWHMNDSESYLMWKVYSDRGCAIETTFERLQIAFDEFPGAIEGTTVEYLDFRRDEMPVGNIYHLVSRKSLPYRDEKEFRLLFWRYIVENQSIPVDDGIKVKVDLKKLISRIWLSPQLTAPRSEIVNLTEQKKMDTELCSSAINEGAREQAASSS